MKKYLLLFLFFNFYHAAHAQDCPENLGFELGNFSKWTAYTGFVYQDGKKNIITKTEGPPSLNRHKVMTSTTEKDYYGNFPVLAPNGSKYSVKLGNEGSGANAESLTYKIKVPTDRSDFALNYQYAVVFEDPSHAVILQPRFNAKVLDIAKNEYIECASFEYIATSGLPGFKKSARALQVLYKDWTSVTLDLSGHQGKELLLEFTTADCQPGGHFGYAYVDVNESCNGIVRGNEICKDATNVVLAGPAGFKDYVWYNVDRTIRYGTGEQFSFNTVFPIGTRILLDLIPYEGFGCVSTINTVIKSKDFVLKLVPEKVYCANTYADLTSANVILDYEKSTQYKVYSDQKLNKLVPDPTRISQSGKYYIKAISGNGCSDVASVNVIFEDFFANTAIVPELKICDKEFADLSNAITKIPTGATISYFSDKENLLPLLNPTMVKSGVYYLKLKLNGCSSLWAVKVANFEPPVLKVANPQPFCANSIVNLHSPEYYLGSTTGLTLTFYANKELTSLMPNPDKIDSSGSYFIKAVDKNGCTSAGRIDIVIETPTLLVTNPTAVCYPLTVNITDKSLFKTSSENVVYSYFDSQNRAVSDPSKVSTSGKYKIVITNPYGCSDAKWIDVVVNPLPLVKITNPKKTLEPYTVDITNPSIISGSEEYERVEYFEDDKLLNKLRNPQKIVKGGDYYIAFYNNLGCVKAGLVQVVIGKKPLVVVPSAFTPLASQNNKLYPFPTSLKKLLSFKIYNKWGNLVFETISTKPEDGWDGFYKGVLQPFETYTWYVEAIDEIDEQYKTRGKTILVP